VAGIYALVSAGGSPGVTTAAVALSLTWPADAILAECDPAGGDILAGLMGGHVPGRQGLMEHAIDAGRDAAAATAGLRAYLVPLDAGTSTMLLPGLSDPRQAAGLAPAWPAVAETLAAQHADVIADCGRLDAGAGQPLAVLTAARTVGLVVRPTLRQVWLARSRVEMLTQLLGGTTRLALLVTGPGPQSPRDVARALRLPVAADFADDPRTAALLSDGIGGRRSVRSAPLMRSARTAGHAMRAQSEMTSRLSAEAGASRSEHATPSGR
jgi:hypothetical protein